MRVKYNLSDFVGDPALQRLADDAMQSDFPTDRFSSREEWNRYNEEQARRDRNKECFGIKDI